MTVYQTSSWMAYASVALISIYACSPQADDKAAREMAPPPAEEDATSTVRQWATLSGAAPIIIGHRGASGMRPAHTIAAYKLAIEQGADFIEPDLVMTKDGALVCRHDRFLSPSTDVADRPEFAGRKTEKDGRSDWWVEDFTLAEFKTLRARQDYPNRSKEFDDQFPLASFDEVIALAKESIKNGRPVGIYPEPKEAAKFTELGFDIETALVEALERAGWTGADAPVIIQSFEADVVKSLNERVETPLIQLVLPKTWFDPDATFESFIPLETMAAYADGVGPDKRLIIGEDGVVTDFIARAHALGLAVHPWTFYGDKPSDDGLAPEAELRRIYELGADGVFADFPDMALAIRDEG